MKLKKLKLSEKIAKEEIMFSLLHHNPKDAVEEAALLDIFGEEGLYEWQSFLMEHTGIGTIPVVNHLLYKWWKQYRGTSLYEYSFKEYLSRQWRKRRVRLTSERLGVSHTWAEVYLSSPKYMGGGRLYELIDTVGSYDIPRYSTWEWSSTVLINIVEKYEEKSSNFVFLVNESMKYSSLTRMSSYPRGVHLDQFSLGLARMVSKNALVRYSVSSIIKCLRFISREFASSLRDGVLPENTVSSKVMKWFGDEDLSFASKKLRIANKLFRETGRGVAFGLRCNTYKNLDLFKRIGIDPKHPVVRAGAWSLIPNLTRKVFYNIVKDFQKILGSEFQGLVWNEVYLHFLHDIIKVHGAFNKNQVDILLGEESCDPRRWQAEASRITRKGRVSPEEWKLLGRLHDTTLFWMVIASQKAIEKEVGSTVFSIKKDDLILLLDKVRVPYLGEDKALINNLSLARECDKWGVEFDNFLEIQDSWERVKFEEKLLPPFSSEKGAFRIGRLDGDDPKGLFLGNYTDCCQSIGGAAEDSVWNGVKDARSAFYVVYHKGWIIGQSWTWIDHENKVICFDNFECLGGYTGNRQVKELLICLAEFLNGRFSYRVTMGTSFSDIMFSECPMDDQPAESPKGCYTDSRERWVLCGC